MPPPLLASSCCATMAGIARATLTVCMRRTGQQGGGGGEQVPLSEDEQRILHEMEQKLYEHDHDFAKRVRADGPHGLARRSVRWSVLLFIAGLAILLFSFRSSLLLGTFGFLVMVFSTLLFERSARTAFRA